ncbi:uncharacterized protein RCC_06994 [Ramularia collo-cygni]|uniref:Uncharacterized protein n=1 Tax=Ramularia collo-cygni TaxID=112498 RepID=A0A2D3VJL4_9PEZI|nr:uncharacterized protein RCC_06994 [Ramularia collo-cygni]CZT21133.1 uncharacterized protein RCC_06994 [Ramularia collo-cygni]
MSIQSLIERANAWYGDHATFRRLLDDMRMTWETSPKIVRAASLDLLLRPKEQVPLIARVQLWLWVAATDSTSDGGHRHLRAAEESMQELEEWNNSPEVWKATGGDLKEESADIEQADTKEGESEITIAMATPEEEPFLYGMPGDSEIDHDLLRMLSRYA